MKTGRRVRPRVLHDLGHVLVLQAQRIGLEGRRVARFVGLDHGAAAARIAADRGQGDREVGGQQAGVDQRAHHGDGAGGVAARVGHAVGLGHRLALAGRQFGKPKTHAGFTRCAVEASMIFGFLPLNWSISATDSRAASSCRHRITRSTPAISSRLASASLRSSGAMLTSSMRHRCEPLADLQAGGAGFAVDEDLGHGVRFSLE